MITVVIAKMCQEELQLDTYFFIWIFIWIEVLIVTDR